MSKHPETRPACERLVTWQVVTSQCRVPLLRHRAGQMRESQSVNRHSASCPLLSQVRARDLFYGLWVNDLFMRRVEANAEWSLFCPNEAPGLAECWGEAFDALYQKFEREGRAKRVIKAQQLWFAILEAQVSETCFLLQLCL